MTPYDIGDYTVLRRNGWKERQTSTYLGYKKNHLIDVIRCLEHNWAGALKGNEVLTQRLEKCYEYFKSQGMAVEEFNEIIKLPCERR